MSCFRILLVLALVRHCITAPFSVSDSVEGVSHDVTARIFGLTPESGQLQPHSSHRAIRSPSLSSASNLSVNLVNNFSDEPMYAYVVGLNREHRPIALTTDGQWYTLGSTQSRIPQYINASISWTLGGLGQSRTLSLPGMLISGRIYVSRGRLSFAGVADAQGTSLVHPSWSDPRDPNANLVWSYLELTITQNEVYADVSFVDFVSLPLSFSMTTSTGQLGSVRGMNNTAIDTICQELAGCARRLDPSWGSLCSTNGQTQPIRVLSPGKYIAEHPGAFADYYTDYARRVFARFTLSQPLTVTGRPHGAANISCVGGNQTLLCEGASRAFSLPSAEEIFDCSGTLGVGPSDNDVIAFVVPRLCAAFQRSTLLRDGGDVQPFRDPDLYYKSDPPNCYAEAVHQALPDGVGYAFPYDDVNPHGAADASGTLHGSDVRSITITAGDSRLMDTDIQ